MFLDFGYEEGAVINNSVEFDLSLRGRGECYSVTQGTVVGNDLRVRVDIWRNRRSRKNSSSSA